VKYKCHTCKTIIEIEKDEPCPKCDEPFKHLQPMCELDHCNCHHEVQDGIKYCEKCGKPCCPICNCHDVAQVSRVTGYLSEVSGWNKAKGQELKDRSRYTIS
jgi:hypothetical protein